MDPQFLAGIGGSLYAHYVTFIHPSNFTTMESITILAAPVSESATEMRVGLAFTTDRLPRAKARWVFSPVMKVVKRGDNYFLEAKPEREEKVSNEGI